MARILIADDEPSFRALLRDILEKSGHSVVEAPDGIEALAAAQEQPFQLILTDQRMPRMGGIELLRKLRERGAAPAVVVLTAYGTIPEAVEAVRLGAADYLTKPLASPAALMAVVSRLLAPAAGDDSFITANPKLKELLEVVDRVAMRDVSVLIAGESGTGKELIARRLHARSSRARGPFVAVNCAALPDTLAESELFGHERGAFTGADRLRRGRFEEADKGTLFLDEVGDLSAAMQAKLLRVLEERLVRRLGGGQDIPVDVRLVAATNRRLDASVDSGAFRRDLYFRLSVVPIELPPLRERAGDIPVLAQHLLHRLAAQHAIAVPEVLPEAISALGHYTWPGNVRELRNVLERALVVRAGAPIRPEDLLLPKDRPAFTAPVPLDRDEREREALLEALRQSAGNRQAAARLLGISVRTLYYRLRRLGLQ
ncbi:MAG: sigma-54 dependent transcriptional regulator [Acidobacteriota bacterium]